MKVPVFSYTRKGLVIKVFKSYHANEKRGDSWFSRDCFIDEKRYREIVEMSFKQGMTEFKDKGPFVVSFFDTMGYKHSLLMNLNDKQDHYEVFIITVMYSKKDVHKPHFIKCHNRLNIWHWYTMDSMSYSEKKVKRVDSLKLSVEKDARKEDSTFISQMKLDNVKKMKGKS